MPTKTILVAAGGTGGHLFPGIAVADELRSRDPETRVIFVGTPKGLESRLVPKAGYELQLLPIHPLNGVGMLRMAKGALAILLGFVLLLWRGVRAAWKAPDSFGTYLAAGLTLSIVLQALINVSVVLGLLPTKGIPLPFISAGGSSLLFTLVSVGLLLNITQHAD